MGQVRISAEEFIAIAQLKIGKEYSCRYMCHCPFHKDDTPSLSVSKNSPVWYCFSCGEGGSWYRFFVKRGYTKESAFEILYNKKFDETILSNKALQKKLVSNFKESSLAEKLLSIRNLPVDDVWVAKLYKSGVGYLDKDYRLFSGAILGPKGSFTFPIVDLYMNLCGWQRYNPDVKPKYKTYGARYVVSFGKIDSNSLYVFEGPWDAFCGWVLTGQRCVATLGCNYDEEVLRWIACQDCKIVFVADNDKPGISSAEKGMSKVVELRGDYSNVGIVTFSKYSVKDLNEMVSAGLINEAKDLLSA